MQQLEAVPLECVFLRLRHGNRLRNPLRGVTSVGNTSGIDWNLHLS